MCAECWNQLGSPAIVTEKTRAAAELIAGVYEHHGAGGGLHVVIDDWNLEDYNLAFCENWIESRVIDASEERLVAERKCLKALKALTLPERASALAIYDGFIT